MTAQQILNLHDAVIQETGGSSGVRDQGAVLGLAELPRQTVFGNDAYPTIFLKTAVLYYFKSALLLFIFSEGIPVKAKVQPKVQPKPYRPQFEIRLENARNALISGLRRDVAPFVSMGESTDALDEFVAMALPCIRRGSELLSLLSVLRGSRQKHYVGSKLLLALAKKRPEVLASIELQELWPILGLSLSMQRVLWDAEDALVCASGIGA